MPGPSLCTHGKFLYYKKGWPEAVTVWRALPDGSQEMKVLDSVGSAGEWTVGKEGIYYSSGDRTSHLVWLRQLRKQGQAKISAI